MGPGNFGIQGNNVTMYIMRLYNEAKYLEPPLPFLSFVCHISNHLPREIQITLMTQEIMEITELEKILDRFQNIREWDMSRRINTPAAHINGNYNQPRGILNFHRGARGGNSDNRGEGWRCAECNVENYAIRTTCFRCNKARECQRSERPYNQQNQPQRGAENNRGVPRGNGSGNRGRGAVSYTHLDVYKRQVFTT